MTERVLLFSRNFKRHYKKFLRGGRYKKDDFEKVVEILIQDKKIPTSYRDHALINHHAERELHIKPDWLLIYKCSEEYVRFIDTGSHADLFS
ncbi:type II toxin-antitoxin system mRNA interferase toxin, RelE/StbE family [Pediococcus ethanolidurans]|uniref:type II toxin-antitoxin system YafQ family toxin n=1 Tax=Pediococcus ethanolidurans TaxID=319653 RepID=UPI0029559715|nr:type II toxin-antitoxin system YafQ family toxin [Pediococcus ethanolidurans]MDV7718308.1 type II toxin-antitoxin system mRNA interferase toxin, RelE/StbE family [Pediococcus ethanolidurans]